MRFVARILLFAGICLTVPAAAFARPADGVATETLLRKDFAAGRIDLEERLLQTFRYVFAPTAA